MTGRHRPPTKKRFSVHDRGKARSVRCPIHRQKKTSQQMHLVHTAALVLKKPSISRQGHTDASHSSLDMDKFSTANVAHVEMKAEKVASSGSFMFPENRRGLHTHPRVSKRKRNFGCYSGVSSGLRGPEETMVRLEGDAGGISETPITGRHLNARYGSDPASDISVRKYPHCYLT